MIGVLSVRTVKNKGLSSLGFTGTGVDNTIHMIRERKHFKSEPFNYILDTYLPTKQLQLKTRYLYLSTSQSPKKYLKPSVNCDKAQNPNFQVISVIQHECKRLSLPIESIDP
uniref:Uncharacterized protein n=1 Tax=Cacopsylla melanoneura TaxID=428564 RepID=A0A8D9DUZ6_9HEMI